jgi:glycosyltransferase involved in cell wall biosynthesis
VAIDGYNRYEFPNVLDATAAWPSLVRRPLWPPLFTSVATRAALRVGRAHPPALVMGQTPLSAHAVRRLARHFRVPSVVKLFGVENLDHSEWSRLRYWKHNAEQILAFKTRPDAWIILDDGTRGAAAARSLGVEPERIHELPNGINLEWAGRPPDPSLRARLGIAADAHVVLYAARLTGWKRPDAFIRMVPRMRERARGRVVFAMAGDGPLRGVCDALIRSLGLERDIVFLGAVAHADIPDLMKTATVFASTNDRTNLGIPTCEAMVCGLPVVAFDTGDTARLLKDGDAGRLIVDGDENAFADAVADVLNDSDARARMSHRAREIALASFTGWQERIGMEIEIVERLLR